MSKVYCNDCKFSHYPSTNTFKGYRIIPRSLTPKTICLAEAKFKTKTIDLYNKQKLVKTVEVKDCKGLNWSNKCRLYKPHWWKRLKIFLGTK